jgi:hypothetical protein
MADIRELMVTIDLRNDLSEAEVNELRWHLGLAPQPPELPVWSALSPVSRAMYSDDDGNLVVDDRPYAILGGKGAGQRIPGALLSALVRRENPDRRPGWALTARQESHPDDMADIEALLRWLAVRADLPCAACSAGSCRVGCEFFAGYLRFYEEPALESYLIFKGGTVGWSERIGRFTALAGYAVTE